jgi:CheY-like chemotaxis protein
VEDHFDSREMLSFLFKGFGYTVLEANDGNEGLQIAADTDLDLIVTDLGLPEMDGFEFVQRVRSLKSDQPDLKIALLTAYAREDCLDAALEAGCDMVLSKPIDLDKLECLISLIPSHSDSRCVSDDLMFTTNTLPTRKHAGREENAMMR